MTHHDCSVLMIAIHESSYKLTPKDTSVLQNIVYRMKHNLKLSDKQSWAVQELYRRAQGTGKRVFHERI